MKKASVYLLIFCVLFLIPLAGCARLENDVNSVSDATEKSEEDLLSGATKPGEGQEEQDPNSNTVPEEVKFFLENQGEKNEVIFYQKQDIDLDGLDETVVGAGNKGEDDLSTNFTGVYILRQNGNMLLTYGGNLAETGGYGVYDVKLIKLQGTDQFYIYLGLTNGGPLTGFSLSELNDSSINTVCYSASATGSGQDYLVDSDSDGLYDGYVQDRSSYDVLYMSTSRSYVWQGGAFVLDSSHVDLPEYPTTVQDVIVQYLSLKVIDDGASAEINQRLSELLINEPSIELPVDVWYQAVANTILAIGNQINFDTKESENEALSHISYEDENGEIHELTFNLIKSEGKWRIDNFF